MNEKEKELFRSLAVLLKKLKKMLQFSSSFFHHHATSEDDKSRDTFDHHKNVDLLKHETVNDATGENAIDSVLKKENLTNKHN